MDVRFGGGALFEKSVATIGVEDVVAAIDWLRPCVESRHPVEGVSFLVHDNMWIG